VPRRPEDEALAVELARRIGERIRRLRILKGLTQAGLSELLGMSTEAYGRLERGFSLPSFPTFVRICSVLETSPDRLLEYECTHVIAKSPVEWTEAPGNTPNPAEEPDPILDQIRGLDPLARRALAGIVDLLRTRRRSEFTPFKD